MLSPSPRPCPKAPPVATAHAGFPQGFQLLRSTELSKRRSAFAVRRAVPPARRSLPTRSAGLDRPARPPTPAVVPTCFLSYASAAGLVRRFLREPPPPGRPVGAARPGRRDCLSYDRLVARFAPVPRFSGGPTAGPTRVSRTRVARSIPLSQKTGRAVNPSLPPEAPARSAARRQSGSRPRPPGGVICRSGRHQALSAAPAAGAGRARPEFTP
jgi:hypothetical protein